MGTELKKSSMERTKFCSYPYIGMNMDLNIANLLHCISTLPCFNSAFSMYDLIKKVYPETHCDHLDNVGNGFNRGFNVIFCLLNGNMIQNVNFHLRL